MIKTYPWKRLNRWNSGVVQIIPNEPIVIVTILLSIIMVLSLTAYIAVHGFISKINIVTTSDSAEYSYSGDDKGTISSEEKVQDILAEEAEASDPGIPETSNEEINYARSR